MKDLFESGAVLFQSDEDEEGLVIECAVTQDGGLAILQESSGPVTEWCYEESPHRIETVVGPTGLRSLMEYFHADEPRQLPAILRMEYTGYDCARRIRSLFARLDVPYRVLEGAICRWAFRQKCFFDEPKEKGAAGEQFAWLRWGIGAVGRGL